MKSVIVIGDIHGCYSTLKALLNKLPQGANISIAVSGDLIDRGPDSKRVVQWAIDNNIPVALGNHEKMMIDFYNGDTQGDVWLDNGGIETLKSYGGTIKHYKQYGRKIDDLALLNRDNNYESIVWDSPSSKKLFEQHVFWMSKLPIMLEAIDVVNDEGRHLVITHSNVCNIYQSFKDGKMDKDIFDQRVLWGRPTAIKNQPNIYNIHGHTPIENGPKIRVPFANIDTGAVFQDRGYGVLTALQYPEMIIYSKENVESQIY